MDHDDDVERDEDSEDASASESESQSDESDSQEEFDMPTDEQLDALMTLESALEESKYRDRKKCAALIDACASARLKERLRTARERSAAEGALDVERWSAWIQDELSDRNSAKRERLMKCDKLFQRAIEDCGAWSAKLYLGWARVMMELEKSADERRVMFERAVTSAGLSCVDGQLIWQAYRAFEAAQEGSMAMKRVTVLYERQLKVPHVQIDATLADAKKWASENGVDAVEIFEKAYAAGMKEMSIREPFEARVALGPEASRTSSVEILRAFRGYIDFEISSGDSDRVKHMYERALGHFSYVGELWVQYGAYCFSSARKSHVAPCDFLRRALRHCPSSLALWKFIIEVVPDDEILRFQVLYETHFKYPTDLAEILTVLIEMGRCGVVEVKRTFDRMIAAYSANNMATAAIGVLDHLTRRALLVRVRGENSSLTDGVLDFLDSIKEEEPFKSTVEFHILFAEYLSHLRQDNRALEVCDLALHRGIVEPMTMSKKTIEEKKRRRAGAAMLSSARLRCMSMAVTIPVERQRHHFFTGEVMMYGKAMHEYEMDLATERLEASNAAKVRKNGLGSRRERAAARREVRSTAETAPRKRSRDVPEGVEKVDMDLKGMDHDSRVKALFPKRDACTAFVKNLSRDVTESQLVGFFNGHGGTVSARIVKDKTTGRSRGIAYVDFTEEAALNAAIMRSGEELEGRALDIAKSRPPGEGARGGRGGRGDGGRHGRGGRVPSTGPGRGRGGLGLMPRTVRAESGDAPKTNADFRAMFTKASE